MPEVLRMKGNLYLSVAPGHADDAETCFQQSLEWSRRQGARAWELRTATDLYHAVLIGTHTGGIPEGA